VRGIVTFAYGGPKGGSFVIEQEGTGIYVSVGDVIALKEFVPRESLPRVAVGDEVEVRGVTAGGGYSPCILPREIRVLGMAPLPPPYPFVLSDVLSGKMESKRVEVRGVVQGAVLRPNVLEWLRLDLATPGQRFVANLAAPGNWTSEQLIGASIRLHAICHPFFNQRGELLGVRLQVARPDDLVWRDNSRVEGLMVRGVGVGRFREPNGLRNTGRCTGLRRASASARGARTQGAAGQGPRSARDGEQTEAVFFMAGSGSGSIRGRLVLCADCPLRHRSVYCPKWGCPWSLQCG